MISAIMRGDQAECDQTRLALGKYTQRQSGLNSTANTPKESQ
jgi:hypothetical protein